MTNGITSGTNGITSEAPLLPCPLCGKKISIARTENEQGERWWFVTRGPYRTTRCDCRLFLESEKFTCGWNDAHALECRRKMVERWNTRSAVTDRDFAMAVHDGELWGKCSECKERQGYYLDAETIQLQQERIAELEAESAYHAECNREATALNNRYAAKLDARDELIRDMLRDFEEQMHGTAIYPKTWYVAQKIRAQKLGIEPPC